MFKEIIAVCSENKMQHVTINTFCKKNADFLARLETVIKVLLQIPVL